jgi:hypothetical protein
MTGAMEEAVDAMIKARALSSVLRVVEAGRCTLLNDREVFDRYVGRVLGADAIGLPLQQLRKRARDKADANYRRERTTRRPISDSDHFALLQVQHAIGERITRGEQ